MNTSITFTKFDDDSSEKDTCRVKKRSQNRTFVLKIVMFQGHFTVLSMRLLVENISLPGMPRFSCYWQRIRANQAQDESQKLILVTFIITCCLEKVVRIMKIFDQRIYTGMIVHHICGS